MPTISRPETDVPRLQALEAARLIGSITAPASLAFSAATLARVNACSLKLKSEFSFA